jgi:hypothetical protein
MSQLRHCLWQRYDWSGGERPSRDRPSSPNRFLYRERLHSICSLRPSRQTLATAMQSRQAAPFQAPPYITTWGSQVGCEIFTLTPRAFFERANSSETTACTSSAASTQAYWPILSHLLASRCLLLAESGHNVSCPKTRRSAEISKHTLQKQNGSVLMRTIPPT